MKTTGILLIQLGTPDSPSTKDVRTYLTEFLNDPRVIDISAIGRKILVNGIIVPFRAPKSAKIYKELWELGNGVSPLMTHTKNVQTKLQKRFGEKAKVFMAMRYQNPSIDSVLAEMKKENFDQIIVLPLFPQYASASTGSAIQKVMDIVRKWWVIPELKIISQFWYNEGYIDSIVDNAKKFNVSEYDHIVFSYHGLPERQVDKVYENDTDLCADHPCESEVNQENKFCYKATSYATTRLIAAKLNIPEEKYTVAFQSRLDKKWLTPFSDKVVEELAKNGAKKILMFSPAFVADCLETLIEIGSEYQEIFEEHGGEKVQLVPSSNDHERFIDGLEAMINERM